MLPKKTFTFFLQVREENRKKIEEERRRVRREKMLFEKNQRESTNSGKGKRQNTLLTNCRGLIFWLGGGVEGFS